jgi:hypothetical protein
VASNPSSDKIAAVRLLMASPGAANSFAEPVKMR